MSPVNRTLANAVLSIDLGSEIRTVGAELAAGHTRIARTLVKEGPLRLTLIGVSPGGALHEHVAEGPITIQVLEGSVVLHAAGEAHELGPNALMAIDGGVRHDVSSKDGGFFLLTVIAAPHA